MDKSCATCIENDDGLCDRKGVLVHDDDTCDQYKESWKDGIQVSARCHHCSGVIKLCAANYFVVSNRTAVASPAAQIAEIMYSVHVYHAECTRWL